MIEEMTPEEYHAEEDKYLAYIENAYGQVVDDEY
jgi:hypothetical protein